MWVENKTEMPWIEGQNLLFQLRLTDPLLGLAVGSARFCEGRGDELGFHYDEV